MTDQRWVFSTFKPIESGTWPVNGIGKKRLQVRGLGTVRIRNEVDGVTLQSVLQEVLYVPKLGANLFTVSSAARNGNDVSFSGDGVKVLKNTKVLAVGLRENNNLYVLNLSANREHKSLPSCITAGKPMESFAAVAKSKANTVQVWHRRLGHVCVATIKKMAAKGMVDGLEICGGDPKNDFCEGCILGKQHRLPFPTTGRVRAEKVGALIHSDLCGPSSTASPGGAKYFVTFKDDYSGFCFINFVKQKSEVFSLPSKEFLKNWTGWADRLELGR